VGSSILRNGVLGSARLKLCLKPRDLPWASMAISLAGLPDTVAGLLIMRRMLQFRGGCFNLEVIRRESFDFWLLRSARKVQVFYSTGAQQKLRRRVVSSRVSY
jgi:hypothetical protein